VGSGATITLLSNRGRITVEKDSTPSGDTGKSLKDSEVKQ
jgi:hypothetical protein